MKPFLKIIDQNALSILFLVLSDLVWGMLAFVAAYYIRNDFLGSGIQPFPEYLTAMPAVALILVGTFYYFGLYERSQRTTKLSEMYRLFQAITFVWLLVMAGSFLYKYDYSRIFVILFYGLGLVFINGGRVLLRSIYQILHRKGIGVVRVLIIGAGKPGKKVSEALQEYDEFGYRIVGFIDNKARKKKGIKILGKLENLVKIIEKHSIHEIYVVDPSISHEKILELIHECDQAKVKFKVVSDLFEIVAGDIDLKELEGLPSLDLKKHQRGILFKIVKRIMDIVIALIALTIMLPLWIFIILAIKLESKGSAVFTQKRSGLNGEVFVMHKFRTMHSSVKANDYAPKTKSDKRITKVGRILRKTSLDELPQFWNVLKGQMSVVGPRPEMPFIVKEYTPWQRRRLDVKPGITGLWQILGRKDLPLHENIEYDFYYIKNQSILLDIVILIKTVAAVIIGKGAY
ncbi:sugar transferase [Candidatus Peregrinibacteria bacterium]|jgi:exopolysaccharide biosynthesis polyprenyl glycosylphosphotransferase|nr:sugar transferase [Candidatus Peregrinibacteria bacterium]MBT7702600.1 sugar transferase [Candidatus Peregrinibacteria bacterium]